MTAQHIHDQLASGQYQKSLEFLYTAPGVADQVQRIGDALDRFEDRFGSQREIRLFSAPGRTEIGGNHTDHQQGRVLAASVNLDVLCVVSPNSDGMIRIQSEGYPRDEMDVSSLELREEEKNTSLALIRGVAARFQALGYHLGGFDAYLTSNVLKGSGLSSSAAFEVAIGTILNHLYNGGTIASTVIAQIGQYAENIYFGKPSGLMDQMASSVGGVVSIDFHTPDHPIVETVPFDLRSGGYELCIVDTGGNHADLTHEYADIPAEMKRVARCFGADYLRQVEEAQFYSRLPQVRSECGDRAVLRAMHFFADNHRVIQQVEALKTENIQRFLELILESGRSSFCYLQNVFAASVPQEQGVSLALALTEHLLASYGGAWRVHGGGFGGTIQVFCPTIRADDYVAEMEAVFGPGTCHRLSIRPVGGWEIKPNC